MEYKVDEKLKDMSGKPIMDASPDKDGKVINTSLTFGIAAKACLSRGLQEDAQKGTGHIMKLALLLQRIESAKTKVELSSEEVSMLKERAGKVFLDQRGAPIIAVIFGFCNALEGK